MPDGRSVERRRSPEQERSRAGVHAILDATATLLNDIGVDQLTMTAIAAEAGLSKAAVYRYFPTKAAVLRELALRVLEEYRTLIADKLASTDDVERAQEELLAAYVELHRSEPYRVQLRSAIRADPELAHLDLADSRLNAKTLADHLRAADGDAFGPDLELRLLVVIELLESVIRLVSLVDDEEADAIVASFAEMSRRHVFTATD
ncbi:MAG: TetR/AcrR family transcriptional regulator [Actinomycetota bacterium]